MFAQKTLTGTRNVPQVGNLVLYPIITVKGLARILRVRNVIAQQ